MITAATTISLVAAILFDIFMERKTETVVLVVGIAKGDLVGDCTGYLVGFSLGLIVGVGKGSKVGLLNGAGDGSTIGFRVGCC